MAPPSKENNRRLRVPVYSERLVIPARANKVDQEGGDLFDLAIYNGSQGMLLKASGVSNVLDFFDIKVRGPS